MNNVDEVISKIGFGKFHLFVLLTMGMMDSCDAMEILLLAFIGPILSCSWLINFIEISFLSTCVFIGMIIGSLVLGRFSDIYGRKPTLLLSNGGIFYFGLLSSISPNIYWMMISRLCVGIFIGGNASTMYSVISEMTPNKLRGTSMVIMQLFWSFGSFLITTISFLVIPALSWRILLIFSTIMTVPILLALIWLPETPKFLLLQNQKSKCLEIINKIAKWNNSEYIIDLKESDVTEYSFRDLFHPNYLSTTIICWILWFVTGISYYGIVLIITIINEIPHRCLQNMATFSNTIKNNLNETIDNSCCLKIHYKDTFISTAGEILFMPISIILINAIGRRRTLSIYFLTISILSFCLNLRLSSLHLSILLFFLRGTVNAIFNVIFIYTAEVFPTSVRGSSIGMNYSISRFGALVSPFIINLVIVRYSFLAGTLTLCGLNVSAFILSMLLPYETKDRKLYQTADHGNTESKPLIFGKIFNYQTTTK